jgi:hypothetical protein
MTLSADDLRRLQADLRSEDPAVRADAFERASEVIDATVLSVVAQALVSENPEVQAKAVELMNRLAEMAE